MKPAALLARAGVNVAQRGPRAQGAVTDDQLGLVQATALDVTEHAGPDSVALAVAVLDRQQLLLAVLADADHDQQTHLRVLTETDGDVDPVHEQVGIAGERQQPLAEPVVMLLPLLAHPADRRRRQAGGVLAEQLLQRGPEVAGRQPAEIEDRDHLADLR